MKLLAFNLLIGMMFSYTVANARPVSGSLIADKTSLKPVQGSSHKILDETYRYEGQGIYISEEEELDYTLTMTFNEDGLIESTVTDDQGESNYAFQWVFASEESSDFTVYLFDKNGEPFEAGSGQCEEDSCEMSVIFDDGSYIEEAFDFSNDLLFKEGIYIDSDNQESYWTEELQLTDAPKT